MQDPSGETKLERFEAPASMDHWETFIDRVTHQIHASISDDARAYKLKLAYEELISNIIRASNSPDCQSDIPVILEVSMVLRSESNGTSFIIRTSDTNRHFDPCFYKRDSVDIQQPVSERKIGGLGLFLIEQSVDKVSYEWSNGKNNYELCMALDNQHRNIH